MPAVSTRTSGCPSSSTAVSIGSRVVPGTSDTIIRSDPKTLFTKVDLPVFGRPTIATRGAPISVSASSASSSSVMSSGWTDAAASASFGGGRRSTIRSARSPVLRPC